MVKRGDTLSEVALRFQVRVDQLQRWNQLKGTKIFTGQQLKLRSYSLPGQYEVRSGDTLSEIAVRFDISLASLCKLNNITGNRIYSGQKLKLRQQMDLDDKAKTHVVREGDTLWDIARIYGLSITELKELNDLERDIIKAGEVLNITETQKKRAFIEDQFEYVVEKGDSLSSIAHRFNVGLGLLRQLNQVDGDHLYPGQRLQLRPSSIEEAVHVVRTGETLSHIALKYGTTLTQLAEINGIKGSKILVGQKLRLKPTPVATHLVERGDALWEIARAYGMAVKELKALNGLVTDRIYPGQELKLKIMASEPMELYVVKEGDYLGRIARLHQMGVSELKKMNDLRTSVIHPGDRLKVNPILRRGKEWLKISEIKWDVLMNSSNGGRKFSPGNGPYFYSQPQTDRQKNTDYFESQLQSPLKNYRQARKLWESFESEVSRLGRLSNDLKGWHIVLDPGHGGLDPGAVVETLDGNGNRVYVVEDEYVYDVALRAYVLLRLHGAEVAITLLSPNHLIRHSNPPTHTFVNEKNEVYNSYELNKNNKWRDWPNGGNSGNLLDRVRIARNAFGKTPKNRRIFLSFHADIDPGSPDTPVVLYYKNRSGTREDLDSKAFAEALLPALGAGSYVRGQGLGVLRDNPAKFKALFEIRNLAYTDHAWALRFEELRHRSAEKVVRGILNFVTSENNNLQISATEYQSTGSPDHHLTITAIALKVLT